MIDREHPLSVVRQAKLLEISRGAVYYRPRQISETDLTLMRSIDGLHLVHPFMGVRMLRRMLLREGIRVGRRHLSMLMQRMGSAALCLQPVTSERPLGTSSTPTCCERWSSAAPIRSGQWRRPTSAWPEGSCTSLLSSMLRAAGGWPRWWPSRWRPATPARSSSRRLPTSVYPRSSTPIRAASSRPRNSPTRCGHGAVACPWTAKCAWRYNVFVERLWRTIKYERVYLRAYDGVSVARADLEQLIHWYNIERPHSRLEDQMPEHTYCALLPALEVAA